MINVRVVRGGTGDGSASWGLRWPAIWSALVLVLAVPGASFGQTFWNATTGNWNTPGNWTLGVPNSASGTAFDAVIENGGTAQLFDAGGSVRRLRVGRAAGGGNLLVSGGGLTVTGDFYLSEGASPELAKTTVQLGGIVTAPTTVVGYAGNSDFLITGAGSRVNATTSFVVGRAGFGTLILADGGTLSIGNGTLPLQVGTLAGGSGSVRIGDGGTAGVLEASAVQFGDGSGGLTFYHTGDLTFSTPITGPGSVSNNGSGTTTLSGPNSYTGYTYVTGGTLAISADANLGTAPVLFNPAKLQFYNGGTLRATEDVILAATRGIQSVGNGTIEVDATKTLSYPNEFVWSGGTMTKTGAGTLSLPNLHVGGTFFATALVVTGGGTLAAADSWIGSQSNEFGIVTVSGIGTTWTTVDLYIGEFGNGTLEIVGGGTLTTFYDSVIGNLISSSGTGTVRGPGSTWNVGGDLTVGFAGDATLNLEDQALVNIGYKLRIFNGGMVNLSGGTLRFDGYERTGTFNFNSGTIQLAGNRSVGTDAAIEDLFGVQPIISTGKGLTVEGTATLTKAVTLDGGAFTVSGLVNGSNLRLNRSSGTLNITNQAVTVGAGGLFGSTLDLANDLTVNVTLGIQNQGLVTGDGQLGGPFYNAPGGELRGQAGRSLVLTGAGNVNDGQIRLVGGELDFDADLTNNAGAFVSGNGSLFTGGLTNHGTMNFAGTANIVGDVTNSATGKIISAGGGATIFFDDVTNQGEIRTSTNGFTVFFGAVTGAGTFTGTGTVNFEGDLKPGNSPAAIQFGGDVAFSSEATFAAEIAGTTPGSQYDQILIAGSASFAGTLDVDLIDMGGGAYVPSVGDQFVLATYARHTGTFNTLSLPPLASGLDWSLDYESTLLTLSVSSTMLPGDIDLDGDVDRTDAALFSQHFGATAGAVWTTGDFDGDGRTTLHDLTLLQANFGALLPSPAASAPVPEPATWVLALFVGIVLVWNRSERLTERTA